MSLTEFIGTQAVRDRISETFPNEGERPTSDLKASWQTEQYTLVGTAFDYLLRFWVRRHAEEFEARPWVSQTALELTTQESPDRVDDVQTVLDRAEQHRDEFLDTGQLTRALVESTLDLARVDWIYRSGQFPENLGEYDQDTILDCLRLMEIVNECPAFEEVSRATLNPIFGVGSWLVGGADADLIVDGCLLDVKATSSSTFKVDYWRQLVGYLTLADIHNRLQDGFYDRFGDMGYDTTPLPNIEDFGIYYARHGEVVSLDASTVYDDPLYPEFREWFIETALEQYHPEKSTLDVMILGEFRT